MRHAHVAVSGLHASRGSRPRRCALARGANAPAPTKKVVRNGQATASATQSHPNPSPIHATAPAHAPACPGLPQGACRDCGHFVGASWRLLHVQPGGRYLAAVLPSPARRTDARTEGRLGKPRAAFVVSGLCVSPHTHRSKTMSETRLQHPRAHMPARDGPVPRAPPTTATPTSERDDAPAPAASMTDSQVEKAGSC